MAYEKQQWDTTSYINPTRMNHIEEGIKSNSNEIESIANNVIAYGECTTARSTSAKVVSCSGFVLKKGSRIAIRFTDTGKSNPSSGNLTLNVNGTGAKTIVDGHANKTILTYANGSYFYNNLVAEFVYDGTYWVYMNRDANTTYTGATLKTGAAKTGSGTTVTDTIAKSTTIDNAIQTLLNNDVAINSNLDKTNQSLVDSYVGNYTLSSTWCVGQYGWALLYVQNPIPKGLYSKYNIEFINATVGYQGREDGTLASDAVQPDISADSIGCRSNKILSEITDYAHRGTITFRISKK